MNRASDADKIAVLYQMYEQSLFWAAKQILREDTLAEDAVQECFLRLIRHRDRIADPTSPQVRAYLFKTLKSAAIDIYRGRKKHRENCVDIDDLTALAAEAVAESREVSEAMDRLPRRYGAVLRCLYMTGLSIRETAAVLKLSEACVRKRCQRGKEQLKRLLEEENG